MVLCYSWKTRQALHKPKVDTNIYVSPLILFIEKRNSKTLTFQSNNNIYIGIWRLEMSVGYIILEQKYFNVMAQYIPELSWKISVKVETQYNEN